MEVEEGREGGPFEPIVEASVDAPPPRHGESAGGLRADEITAFPPCDQLEVPLPRAYSHANGCAPCRGRGGWHCIALQIPDGPRYLLSECIFRSPCGASRGNLAYVNAHVKLQACEECAKLGGLGAAIFVSASAKSTEEESPTFTGGLSGPKGVVLNGHSQLPATIFVVERMEFPVVPLAVIYERDRQMGYRGTFNDFVVEMMLDCIERHLRYNILVAEGAPA